LYPQVWNFENLYRAYRKARKGKRSKAYVAAFATQKVTVTLKVTVTWL
jgi:hypothetical protein